jgi:hypothetical protein
MTSIQVYAFFILPFIVMGLGWAAALANDWYLRRKRSERQRHG